MKAYISEIFSSIQGEGPFTGEPQVFLRLAGCPLRCDYCDTPESLSVQGHPEVDVTTTAEQVINLAKVKGIKTVSVTGGEPLAQAVFLKELLPLLKKAGLNIYLETAGAHPDALRSLIQWVDVVSMDIKLPSAIGKELWSEHKEFLDVAQDKAFVKIVIEKHSNDEEINTALALASRRTHPPTVVLQPVTSINENIQPPDPDKIGQLYERAKAQLPRVLVMPQQHKIWGIR